MHQHPELASEQAYLERALAALEAMRETAQMLRDSVLHLGAGGTHAARVERDVFVQTALARLEQLEIGREALIFGRIDTTDDERYYIGRVAVASEEREPLVVDWRAPVAEPFYRATGADPMGLELRRHFLSEGQRLVAITDEHLGDEGDLGLGGTGALEWAMDRARTGRMRDIVATIQREQDEIIRAPMPGVLVVQGGPGTGKTAVALHRAAYLLFTHRFALDRDGVLVVGPNQPFLRYIDRVLPALGESGVALSTVLGLRPEVRVRAADPPATAKLKGETRMAKVVKQAVRDRQQPLRRPLRLTIGKVDVSLTVAESRKIIDAARRRRIPHNDTRRHVRHMVVSALYRKYVRAFEGTEHELDRGKVEFTKELRGEKAFHRALEWMWPSLHAHELVHDLLGSKALIRSAAGRSLTRQEVDLLYRPWAEDFETAPWTPADVPLVDEARAILGPYRRRNRPEDEISDYGHIIVDEVQDLSPMALRMLARRSRTGSMTIVGDLAQATGDHVPRTWQDVLDHLPVRQEPRVASLSINYRTPQEIVDLAGRVLQATAPHLPAPEAARATGDEPVIERTAERATSAAAWADKLAAEVAPGTVAVLAPRAMLEELREGFSAAGVTFGEADVTLEEAVTLVAVEDAKGLEFDAVVVIEPSAIVGDDPAGGHVLYVALTRATKRLVVLHSGDLPESMR